MEDNFFEKVFAVVRAVPRGRVTSYGAIANYLSAGRAARMVGYAMRAAESAKSPVPAHRVVNRAGVLSGKHHFGSPTLMQQLLENEKIEIAHDKVVHFKQVFWDPHIELKK